MSEKDELQHARDLFFRFHRREPTFDEISLINRPKAGVVVLEVGSLVQLAYHSLNGNDYRHDFKSPYAKLFVSADGRQIFAIGGGYRFTRRGFVR